MCRCWWMVTLSFQTLAIFMVIFLFHYPILFITWLNAFSLFRIKLYWFISLMRSFHL
ncbi:hypothetical protein Gohar_026387 [Gossypium harknessii]|uniref:Uncharacterized protein n=1 Tax=Gossypium harknessii TaxID=34285 RepID=A0A7J9HRF4_9ROSI|nr:hypothetical protein [Gossypium harknessii]